MGNLTVFSRVIIVFGMTAILSGCAVPRDSANLAELQEKESGVIFLTVAFSGLKCLKSTANTGKKVGDHYEMSGIIYLNKPTKIEAGEHYVTRVFCLRSVTRTQFIGNAGKGRKAGFTSTFGKFSFRAGEVVDAGKLIVHVDPAVAKESREKIDRPLKVEAVEHSESEKAALLAKYPNLYSRAKRRLITPIVQGFGAP